MGKWATELLATLSDALGVRKYTITGAAGIVSAGLAYLYNQAVQHVSGLPYVPPLCFFLISFLAFLFFITLQHATKLRKDAQPKLKAILDITDEREGPNSATAIHHTKGIRIVRVRVEAITSESVETCQAVINKISKTIIGGTEFEVIHQSPAIWIGPGTPTVHPKIPKWFDVVCSREGLNKLQFHGVVAPLRLLESFTEKGVYRFEVSIGAPTAPTETIVFDVFWNGQWDAMAAKEVSFVS